MQKGEQGQPMCAQRVNGQQGFGAQAGACLDLSANRRGWSASTLWHAHTKFWTSSVFACWRHYLACKHGACCLQHQRRTPATDTSAWCRQDPRSIPGLVGEYAGLVGEYPAPSAQAVSEQIRASPAAANEPWSAQRMSAQGTDSASRNTKIGVFSPQPHCYRQTYVSHPRRI